MAKCFLLCMAFDGEYVIEREVWNKDGEKQSPGPFLSHDDANEHSNNMGSKWFFYPFHFLISESEKTITSAPDNMQYLVNERIATVAKLFKEISERPEMKDATVEYFANIIYAETLIPGSTKPINI